MKMFSLNNFILGIPKLYRSDTYISLKYKVWAYAAVLSWIAVTPLFGGFELERLEGSLVVNLSYKSEKSVKNSRFHAQFDYEFCSKRHRNNELLS